MLYGFKKSLGSLKIKWAHNGLQHDEIALNTVKLLSVPNAIYLCSLISW